MTPASSPVRAARRRGLLPQSTSPLAIQRRSGLRAMLAVFAVLVVLAIPLSASPQASPTTTQGGSGWIAFYRGDTHGIHLYLVRPSGENAHAITSGSPIDTNPAWSPSGRLLAFSRQVRTGRVHLYTLVVGTKKRQIQPLTAGRYDEFGPSWSPSGRQIAFVRQARGAEVATIEIMPAKPGGQGRRVIRGRVSDPSWSPNRSWIAFTRYVPGDAGLSIWMIHPNGRGLRRLTPSTVSAEGPAWSPDGTRIAFMLYSPGSADVATIRPDGGDLQKVTDDHAGYDIWPAWSPDSKRLAFSRELGDDRSRVQQLATVDADGTDFHLLGVYGVAPEWRPR
jgi:Tol biopolymer transport system component